MQANAIARNYNATDASATRPRPALRPYSAFLKDLNKTTSTGWRYAKLGWVTLINIAGKNYIAREVEDEFLRRAQAGEFSKKPVVPRRKEAEA